MDMFSLITDTRGLDIEQIDTITQEGRKSPSHDWSVSKPNICFHAIPCHIMLLTKPQIGKAALMILHETIRFISCLNISADSFLITPSIQTYAESVLPNRGSLSA